jgi:hypothetical protein
VLPESTSALRIDENALISDARVVLLWMRRSRAIERLLAAGGSR